MVTSGSVFTRCADTNVEHRELDGEERVRWTASSTAVFPLPPDQPGSEARGT